MNASEAVAIVNRVITMNEFTIGSIFGLMLASISTYLFYLYMAPSTFLETLVFLISGFVAGILVYAAGFCGGLVIIIFIMSRLGGMTHE